MTQSRPTVLPNIKEQDILRKFLMQSIFNNVDEALRILRANPNLDVDVPENLLVSAIETGNLDLVKALVSRIPNINEMHHFDGSSKSPLCHAIIREQLAIAEYLADVGADVTYRGSFSKAPTVIHLACMSNAVKGGALIGKLLKLGADTQVNKSVAFYGKPERCLAISLKSGCSAQLFELLLRYDAKPMSTDNKGVPAIWLALTLNLPEHAELLFKYDVSPFFHLEGNPLETAIINAGDETLRQLLRRWRVRRIATKYLPVYLFMKHAEEGQFWSLLDPLAVYTFTALESFAMKAGREESLQSLTINDPSQKSTNLHP